MDSKIVEWKYDLPEINSIARDFWKAVKGHRVFAFEGEMGAGKTTFIHALCEEKGVTDLVTSPTFSLINEYRFKENQEEEKIFHIDLYRISDEEEAIQAGIEDCLYSGAVCMVEWPGKAPHIFPPETVDVSLSIVHPDTRLLKLQFHRHIL